MLSMMEKKNQLKIRLVERETKEEEKKGPFPFWGDYILFSFSLCCPKKNFSGDQSFKYNIDIRFCYFSVECFAIGFHSNLCPFDLALRFALRVVVLGLFFLSGARFISVQPVFPPPVGCGFLFGFFSFWIFSVSFPSPFHLGWHGSNW